MYVFTARWCCAKYQSSRLEVVAQQAHQVQSGDVCKRIPLESGYISSTPELQKAIVAGQQAEGDLQEEPAAETASISTQD